MANAKYTDNIDERGHTLADAIAENPLATDWEWGTAVTLATSAAADDILDATAHGFTAGDVVTFLTKTGGTGLSVGTIYYVIAANLAADTFQVSATPGGSAVNFTTDITAGTVAPLQTGALAYSETGPDMTPAQTDAEVDAQTG